MNANEKRVGVVNDLGGQLVDKGHINSDEIKDTIDGLNTKWVVYFFLVYVTKIPDNQGVLTIPSFVNIVKLQSLSQMSFLFVEGLDWSQNMKKLVLS